MSYFIIIYVRRLTNPVVSIRLSGVVDFGMADNHTYTHSAFPTTCNVLYAYRTTCTANSMPEWWQWQNPPLHITTSDVPLQDIPCKTFYRQVADRSRDLFPRSVCDVAIDWPIPRLCDLRPEVSFSSAPQKSQDKGQADSFVQN